MLAYLRGRASGALIKIVFGLIILSFMLFFGYTKFEQMGLHGSGSVAARVNGEEIPTAYYQQRLDEAMAQLRRTSGGVVSPDLEKFFRSNLIHQLVADTVKIQWSKKIGLEPPAAEVATAIIKTPALIRDGVFDETFYRTVWRGYIENQYGKDFERMIADSLAVEKMQSILADYNFVAPDEARQLYDSGQFKMQLDVAEAATDPKKRLQFKKTELVSLKDRTQLIAGNVALADWEKIVALKVGGILKEPVVANGKSYVIRKIAQTAASDKTWDATAATVTAGIAQERGNRLASTFIDPFQKSAKVVIAPQEQ